MVFIPSYAANIKIGFIDTNIVVSSLTQYKESIDSISREFEPKKQELLNLFNHIELLKANIESTQNSSASKSLNEELKNLAKLELNFKEETEFWQKTMNNKKLILLNNIEMIVNQPINEYAIQEEYDLILYENVAFVSDKVDITEEIIKKIESLNIKYIFLSSRKVYYPKNNITEKFYYYLQTSPKFSYLFLQHQ